MKAFAEAVLGTIFFLVLVFFTTAVWAIATAIGIKFFADIRPYSWSAEMGDGPALLLKLGLLGLGLLTSLAIFCVIPDEKLKEG